MALVWVLLAAALVTQTLGSPLVYETGLQKQVQLDQLKGEHLSEPEVKGAHFFALKNEIENGNEINDESFFDLMQQEDPLIELYNETWPVEADNKAFPFPDFHQQEDPLIELYNETWPVEADNKAFPFPDFHQQEDPVIELYNETRPVEADNKAFPFPDFHQQEDPVIELYNETRPVEADNKAFPLPGFFNEKIK